MNDISERRTRGVEYRINGIAVTFADHVVTGREALTEAGHLPASEHQLILIKNRRTRLIGLDDELDLRDERDGFLRAFRSDRTFAFTVEEVGQVWGEGVMEVDEFVTIWPPRDGHDWIVEREDEPDSVLSSGGILSFEEGGVEDVVSRRSHHADTVMVRVVTTAGTFPAEGNKRYPAKTSVATVLADAARKLHLAGVENWIVAQGGRDVEPSLTLAQAGLSGEVVLEWGPREGGGGA